MANGGREKRSCHQSKVICVCFLSKKQCIFYTVASIVEKGCNCPLFSVVILFPLFSLHGLILYRNLYKIELEYSEKDVFIEVFTGRITKMYLFFTIKICRESIVVAVMVSYFIFYLFCNYSKIFPSSILNLEKEWSFFFSGESWGGRMGNMSRLRFKQILQKVISTIKMAKNFIDLSKCVYCGLSSNDIHFERERGIGDSFTFDAVKHYFLCEWTVVGVNKTL